jgi:DNA-binding IclR family transcriptional regulator
VSEQTTSAIGVLDKAVVVLNALSAEPLSLAGLVAATGFHRATAHRLATSLELHGLVRRDGQGRFCLGGRLVELGQVASRGLPLAEIARPALRSLVEATGESAQLYVLDGDSRLCVESVESPHGLRTIVSVGARLPLDRGSAGAVLRGMTLPLGFAESVGEREAGVASVSAPIVDSSGVLRAAVSVSGPIERTTREPGARYGALVQEAALAIRAAAGWAAS